MDNPFGKMIDILIAVILMFVFPLLYFGLRTDTITQQVVSTKAANFVDTVRTQGYLTKGMYETFLQQLDATNNIYNIHLEHREFALEPEYRFKTPEEVIGDQDAGWRGDNIYHYHPVTTEIPKIIDPVNTAGMNSETNESILTNAVNRPADPNHIHTEECYGEHGGASGIAYDEKFTILFNPSTSSGFGDAVSIVVFSEDRSKRYFMVKKNNNNNGASTYNISIDSSHSISGFNRLYTGYTTTDTAFHWYNVMYQYVVKLYTEKYHTGSIPSDNYYFTVTYKELIQSINEVSSKLPLIEVNPLVNQFPNYIEAALPVVNAIRIDYKFTAAPNYYYYDYDIYNVEDNRLLVRVRKETSSGSESRYMAYNYNSSGNLINTYNFFVSATQQPIGCEGWLWWNTLQRVICAETGTGYTPYKNVSYAFSRDIFLTKLSNQIYESQQVYNLNGVISSITESQLERDLLGFVEATLYNSKVTVPLYSVKDIRLGNRLYTNAVLTRTKSDVFTNYLGEIGIYYSINNNTCNFTYVENRVEIQGTFHTGKLVKPDLLWYGMKGTYYVYEGINRSRIKPTTWSDRNYNYIPDYDTVNLTLENGSNKSCIIQYAGGYKNGTTYYIPKFPAFTGYINKLRHTQSNCTTDNWGTHYRWYYDWWNNLSYSWYSSGVVAIDYPGYESPFEAIGSGQSGDFYVFHDVDTSYYFEEDYYNNHDKSLHCYSIITGIMPTNPIQKVYLGEPLITTAIATFLDGSTKVVVCSANFEPDTLVIDKIVTLSYYELVEDKQTGPFTGILTVTVIPRTKTCPYGHIYNLSNDGLDPGCPYCEGWLKSLKVKSPESGEIKIYRGTTLIDNGVVLLATYLNGREEILYSGYIDNLDKYYVGTQNVTISYKGKNTSLKVMTKRNLKKCDICGKHYELYPDDTDPGCPFCRALVPVFTGNVLKYYAKTYSNEILQELNQGTGIYYFKNGDYLTIDIINRSDTYGIRLMNSIVNQTPAKSIRVEYGGSIRDEKKVIKK